MVRKILQLLILVLLTQASFGFKQEHGQFVVGDRAKPHASAVFQIESTTQGYLTPRMTTIQMNAVASPAEGLQVFNTNTNSLQIFAGGSWSAIGGGGSDHPLWSVATGYGVGTIIVEGLTFKVYRANFAHTSDATLFATDLALGYWDELSDDLDRLAISVDETLPRFDGTTGGLIQSSGVTISDTDGVGNVTNLAIGSVSTLTSSIFDTTSTTQGTRPCPNMTEVQRDAIVAPADGLCIYNSSTDKLNLYNGTTTAWEAAGGGLNKWLTATAYAVDDVIWEPSSDKIYRASTGHTSSAAFLTDIANWTELSQATYLTTLFDSINEINGPVTHMANLQEIYSHNSSAGIFEGGALTDNADGTISIAESSVALRVLADSHSNLVHATVAASGVLALTDAASNYVYIDYNAGTPQWVVSTAITATNGQDKVLGYVVARRGTILKVVDTRESSLDFAKKADELFKDFGRFIHKDGGSVIGSTGLSVTVTSGRFYYGINPIDHGAFDTSIAGTAPANVYTSIYGSYTITDDVKLIDNINYDNAGTLTALGVGKWKVDWLYMVNDSPSTLALIYGDAQYNNQAAAELAVAPASLPPALEGVGVLIGRYLVQEGVASVIEQSSFERTFASASVTNHNDLASLQGGTTDEYYHLALAEYTIATQAATNLLDGYVTILAQSFAGIKTFVNGLLVDAGLVATPSIANSADTNTGIYFPVADSLGITTGGVEKLLVNDHVSITDDDGNFKVRKESRIRNIDQFKSTTPSSIYTEAGLTNAVTNETTTPIDGAQSAKFTVTTGDDLGTITRDAATSLLPKDYQLLGIHFDWLYDGNNGDVSLKIEESTDGITYTDLAEISLPKATEATLAKLNFKLSSTSVTHYRYLFYINVAVNGAIAEWDNVKVITDPLPTAQSAEESFYSIEQDASAMTDITGEVRYALSSATILSDYGANITVDDDGTRTRFIAGAQGLYKFKVSGQVNGNGYAIRFYKNDVLINARYHNTNAAGQYGSESIDIELNDGEYLSFGVNGNSFLSATNKVTASISHTASSSNVVFEGHATDTEWTSYTPTITGLGTIASQSFKYRRVGNSIEAEGTFVMGTGTAIDATMSLPSNLQIDTTSLSIPSNTSSQVGSIAGRYVESNPSGNRSGSILTAPGSNSSLVYFSSLDTTTTNHLIPMLGSGGFGNGLTVNMRFTVPIQGWKVTDPLLSVPVTNERLNSISLEGNDGRTITVATEDIYFSGSANGWTSGVDGTDSYYTVQGEGSNIYFSGGTYGTASISTAIDVYINGIAKKRVGEFINSATARLFEGTLTSKEVSEGDKISFRFSNSSSTLSNTISLHNLNLVETYKPEGYFLGNLVPTQHVTGGTEYTTSETWNGKPVYARSYEILSDITSSGVEIDDIGNVDPVDWIAYFETGADKRYAVGGATGGTNYAWMYYTKLDGKIKSDVGGAYWIHSGTRFTIKYTK